MKKTVRFLAAVMSLMTVSCSQQVNSVAASHETVSSADCVEIALASSKLWDVQGVTQDTRLSSYKIVENSATLSCSGHSIRLKKPNTAEVSLDIETLPLIDGERLTLSSISNSGWWTSENGDFLLATRIEDSLASGSCLEVWHQSKDNGDNSFFFRMSGMEWSEWHVKPEPNAEAPVKVVQFIEPYDSEFETSLLMLKNREPINLDAVRLTPAASPEDCSS